MGETVLETVGLRKDFGGLTAIDDLSVEFDADDLTAVIGPNGAGKTTFFNLLSGTLPPTKGEIYFQGEEITDLGPPEVAKRGLVRSFQSTQVFDGMTVMENVAVAAQVHAGHNPFNFWNHTDDFPEVGQQTEEAIKRVNLWDIREREVANLSHGDRRVLELAIALAADPEMLLLDEPSSGMGPEETSELRGVIADVAATLPTIIIEHKMSVVMEISDRIIVLHRGGKIADGSPDEVQGDEHVRRVYLGSE